MLAASTKSWLMMGPRNKPNAGRLRSPQYFMNGAVRISALWPQYAASPSCSPASPVAKIAPYPRLALHEIDHAQQRRAAQQTVGIQHHEVAVTAAPAPQEVGDVAALVAQMRDAAAIMNAAAAVQLLPAPMPAGLLGQPHLGIAAVGKYEAIELDEMTGAMQRQI